jgi:Cu/Ag efflux protein CusF
MKQTIFPIFLFALALSLAAPGAALAQAAQDHGGHQMAMPAAGDKPAAPAPTAAPASDAAMTEGEVRKIDKAAGKLTLKHGAIKNLDMEPMTMVFRVADPAMLDQVKPGDKVRFSAEKVGGLLTVTRIAPAP